MRIAIDARIIKSTTGRYVERLLRYLQEIDKTNEYIILIPTKDLDYWKPSSANFSVVPADFGQYSIAEQTGFKSLLDSLDLDLVHFCMPQQPVLYKGLHVTSFLDLTLLRSYSSDKNWLMYHTKQLIGKYVFKRVARTSAHIIAISEYTKKDLINFAKIPENKVTVTLLASDINSKGSKKPEIPYEKYIMYVGRQADYKNIRKLADAHQRLIKKYPDLGLILVGSKDASTQTNENLFNHKKYKNILFTGFMDDENVNWLYENTLAYVFPSLMEGFGLPGLEAMEHGAPVVSSNATCLPEVYGDAAHYFDPTNVSDMAKAIDEVLSDEKLRKKLVKNGLEQVKKYSWEKTAQQTHDIYMKVLENKD